MRPALTAALLAFAFLLAGCGGGGSSKSAKATEEGPIVSGAKGVYIFRPAGTPKALVIFFHGQGGPTEATPHNHTAWFQHLVARGNVVVYPTFELDYSRAVMKNAVAGIRTAVGRVDVSGLPVLAIGHSRGAALAVEYAAVAKKNHVPAPGAVLSVEPVEIGEQTHVIDFHPIDHATRIVFMLGDRDPGAGPGARYLLRRLANGGFPGSQVRLDFVRSHNGFVADHMAVMGTSPAAQAAFWAPADRLLADLER
jgi:poly(3-hydroxybutyrate) depolymerase